MTKPRWIALAVAIAVVAAAAGFWSATRRREPSVPLPKGQSLFDDPRFPSGGTARMAGVLLTTGAATEESAQAGIPIGTVLGGDEGRRAIRDLLLSVETELAPVLARGPEDVRAAVGRATTKLRASLDESERGVPVRAYLLSWQDGWAFARFLPGFDRYDALALFDHADPRLDARRTFPPDAAATGVRLIVGRFVKGDAAVTARRAAGAIETHELAAMVASAGPQGPEAEPVLRHVGIIRTHFPPAGNARPTGLVLTRDGTVVSYGPEVATRRWTGPPRLAEDLRTLLAR